MAFTVYNYWWGLNARKVKRTMRNRLRWSEEVWNRHIDRCCVVTWALDACKPNPDAFCPQLIYCSLLLLPCDRLDLNI